MNRKKVLLMALVIALGFLSTLSVWAGGRRANLLRKWWYNDRFAARLHLTPAQKHQLDELFSRHQLEFIDLRSEVDKTAARLEQAMESKNFSEERARKRLAEVQRAKDRLDKARMEYLLEVRGILSQEQFMTLKKVTEMRRQRKK